jgi:hypothetical protein
MDKKFVLVDAAGKQQEVLEVYESFGGWYWYITEKYSDDPDVVYGFVQGFEEEWGDIYMPELQGQIKKGMVWSVPKSAWSWTGRNRPMVQVEA